MRFLSLIATFAVCPWWRKRNRGGRIEATGTNDLSKGFSMLARDEEASVPPIDTKDQLVAYLEAGNKPPADWRIGTEHEKFGFHTADLTPVPYEGPSGISALLQEMCTRYRWEPVH